MEEVWCKPKFTWQKWKPDSRLVSEWGLRARRQERARQTQNRKDFVNLAVGDEG